MSQKIASLSAEIGVNIDPALRAFNKLGGELNAFTARMESALVEFAKTGRVSAATADGLNKTSDALDKTANSAANADKNVDGTNQELKETQTVTDGAGKKLLALAAKYISFGAAVATAKKFLTSSLDAYGASEVSAKRLETMLIATGRAAEISGEQISAMASDLSGLSAFDDEAIQDAYTAIAQFENVPTDRIEDIIKAAMDMTAAFGGDLAGNANEVARVLETGLIPRSWGFSDALKEQIKKQIEAGKTGEALTIILDQLNKRYGGQAQAQLETYTGKMAALKNAWENVLEISGEHVANILSPAIDSATQLLVIYQKVDKAAKDWGVSWLTAYKAVMAGTKNLQYGPPDIQYGPQPEDYAGWDEWAAAGYTATQEVVDGMDSVITKTTELQDAITAMGGAEFKLNFLIDYAQQYDEVNAAIKANESEIASMRLRGIKDTDPEMQRLLRQNEELKGSMQEYLNNLLFSFAQQQVMVGGITQDEMKNVMDYGVELGIFSQEAADAATVAWGDWLTLAQSGLNKMATDTDDVWTVTTDHITSMLEAIPNKVTVTVQREGEGGNSSQTHSSQSEGGGGESQTEDRPYATGGQLRSGRWSVVGERGWELISPTGYVYSHEKSKQMTHNARPFAEGGQMADMDLSAAFDRLATRIIYGVRDAVQQVV